jgi:predicted ATP-grasp superfamily ATP-dependent carboligase
MMQNALLILGASARAAAYSAVRAGYQPWAADSFGDADLLAVCPQSRRVADYPAGLERELAHFPPSPWMYTGALENHPDLVDRLATQRPLWGTAGQPLRSVRDPFQVGAALQVAGLHYPEVVREPAECREGNWLRKPFRSSGGDRIERFAAAGPAGSSPGGGGRRFFWQRFVAGTACSAAFVAARGRAVLLGVTHQLSGLAWAGAQGFQYSGSVGPVPDDGRLQAAWQAIGSCLAERFALSGLFGVDGIIAGDEIWTLEVNPRYTASLEVLERGLGLRVLDYHAGACRDGILPASPPRAAGGWCGKIVVYARGWLTVPADWPAYVEQINADADWPALADIPLAGTSLNRGQPVLTVLAAGLDRAAVERQLRCRVQAVQQRLGC